MRPLEAYPPWSSDKTYLSIEITSIGRRPVAIGNVGIKYFSGSGALIAHSLIEQEKRVLTEENPQTHILTDESELDFPNIRYIAVYDKKGQEHRKYVSIFPTIQKALFWLRKKKPRSD